MSEHPLGPPMDPANPFLRVELLLAHDDGGFHVLDRSNVPLGINWERAFANFIHDQTYVLPSGNYVFTVRYGEGFRVEQLPTEGLSEQTHQALIALFQPFAEEKFRTLCVGLVSFPTPLELRLVARGIVFASAKMAITSLQDPDKLQSDFLTLVPIATNQFSPGTIVLNDVIELFTGFRLLGGMVAVPGIPNESGHLEVKVGYLPENSINDWLNAALVGRLSMVVEEVRDDVLRDVVVLFDDKRSWYGRAGARLRKLLGL